MSTSQSSTCVYVRDDAHGWLPAHVLSYDAAAGTANVSVSIPGGATPEERSVDLAAYESGALPLQNVDEAGTPIVREDMCDLPSLHEAAILYNLRARHLASLPYTRVGDIIIAMNPFRWIDGIYADDVRERYVDRLVWREGSSSGQEAGSGGDGAPSSPEPSRSSSCSCPRDACSGARGRVRRIRLFFPRRCDSVETQTL